MVKRRRVEGGADGPENAVAGALSPSGETGAAGLSTTLSRLFAGSSGGASGSFLAAAVTAPSAFSSSSSSSKPSIAAGAAAARAAAAAEAATSAAGGGGSAKRKRGRDGEEAAAKAPLTATEGNAEQTGEHASGPAASSSTPETRRRTEEENREREARTLFVGNVPLAWDKKALRGALRTAVGDKYDGPFSPIWFRAEPLEEKWTHGKLRKAGSILGAYKTDNAADAKHAYVVLGSPEDVATVRRVVHGLEADERHILRADGVGEQAKLQSFDRKRSVFVGNLPPGTSEDDLRKVFAKAGSIDAVRIVRDRDSKACKGIAFVLFRERSSVKAALNKWGADVKGRQIRVTKVEDRDEKENGGGWGSKTQHPAAQRQEKREGLRRRAGKTGRKKAPPSQRKGSKSKVGFVKAKGSKAKKGPKKEKRKMKVKGAQKK